MTNIPGLFAVGECDYQYHGANRLGANSLLSCLTSGAIAGPAVCKYADGQEVRSKKSNPAFAAALTSRTAEFETLRGMDGGENPFQIWRELGKVMTENVTVVRDNAKLEQTIGIIDGLQNRYAKVTVSDSSGWTNQTLPFTRQLGNMLTLARVITKGALHRDESRGAHYKPEFPNRDDERFQKTTVATFDTNNPRDPKIGYEAVDLSQVKPRARVYTSGNTKPAGSKE
jgi:succinate dehydrogenase / fumarate reductase flavoprotein subunit